MSLLIRRAAPLLCTLPLWLPPPARAQTQSAPQPTAQPQTQPPSQPQPPAEQPADLAVRSVAPQDAMAAYNALEGWIRAMSMPDKPEPPKGLETCGACYVTLRLDHHVISRAYDFAGGPEGFLRVCKASILQAAPHLPVGHDALAEQQLKQAAARVTISLELAGTLIPIKIKTFTDADELLEPGLDGIAARFDDTIAGTFPAAMLIMNKAPSQCLAAAISDASGDATLAIDGAPNGQPGVIADQHHATYYRFRVLHLAQTAEGGPPEFLFRGERVVAPQDITTRTLRDFADMLAGNLLRRAQGGHMRGTLLPAQGFYAEDQAGPLEQATAAMALAEYSRLLPSGDKAPEPGPSKSTLISTAHDLLAGCADAASADPTSSAAWIIAAADLVNSGGQPINPGDLVKAKLDGSTAACFDPEAGWNPEIAPPRRSLIALAIAVQAAEPGLDADQAKLRNQRARAAVNAVFQGTTPASLVSQMPWLGRAEVLLAGDQPIAAAPALRDMRDMVWRNQITPEDAAQQDQDLTGGIVFTSSRNPLPTWQSVRPISFLAQMAGDPRLTDEKEKLGEISHLLAAMRFLRQLTLDEASAYSAENPTEAIGGVRSSLWDQRQPVEATAMTLMTVTEMLKTLTPKPTAPAPSSPAGR